MNNKGLSDLMDKISFLDIFINKAKLISEQLLEEANMNNKDSKFKGGNSERILVWSDILNDYVFRIAQDINEASEICESLLKQEKIK